MNITYSGLVPNGDDASKHISEAIAYYKKKFGIEPTLIVVRPNAPPEYDECPFLVRSRFGMAYGMLLTHLVSPGDLPTTNYQVSQPVRDEEDLPLVQEKVDIRARAPDRHNIPSKERGRPVQGSGKCPHCGETVKNFKKLGWWWGWERGIEPPYWEDLRRWVFSRDNHTCQKCHKMFSIGNLNAHHIEPKESGGTDSARNLLTLCNECHMDTKPIFADQENG